jgi:hypothetical protein
MSKSPFGRNFLDQRASQQVVADKIQVMGGWNRKILVCPPPTSSLKWLMPQGLKSGNP